MENLQERCSKRGGARIGSGRKKDSGVFGEKTEPIRIPVSIIPEIKTILTNFKNKSSSLEMEKEVFLKAPYDLINLGINKNDDLIVNPKSIIKNGDIILFNHKEKREIGVLCGSNGCWLIESNGIVLIRIKDLSQIDLIGRVNSLKREF